MAGSDFSSMNPLFKEEYGPALTSELNDSTPMLDTFKKVSDIRWQGKYHVEPLIVNRNRGSYWSKESGAAPTSGRTQIEWLRIPCRFFHGSCQFTVQAIKASQSDKGSFARLMTLEMDRLLKDMRVQRNFAIWGDGRGVRALVNESTPTGNTTLELDAPAGIANANHGTRFLNVDDHIAFITPSSGALAFASTRRITAVNSDGTDVTLDSAPASGAAENDFIVKAFGPDTSLDINDTEYLGAAMGIRGIVDNGGVVNDYFGQSRVTFPILQSYVLSSAGAISPDLIQRAIDTVGIVGQGRVTKHCMGFDTRRALLAIMENDRRYTHEYLMKPDAGTKIAKDYMSYLTFGGVPVYVDQFAPFGEWYGLDTSSFRRVSMTDGEWADETGAVLTEVTGSVDTYKALYRIYENYFALSPNQCFRISGINTNIVVAQVV
jgi:hypothetical protein